MDHDIIYSKYARGIQPHVWEWLWGKSPIFMMDESCLSSIAYPTFRDNHLISHQKAWSGILRSFGVIMFSYSDILLLKRGMIDCILCKIHWISSSVGTRGSFSTLRSGELIVTYWSIHLFQARQTERNCWTTFTGYQQKTNLLFF